MPFFSQHPCFDGRLTVAATAVLILLFPCAAFTEQESDAGVDPEEYLLEAGNNLEGPAGSTSVLDDLPPLMNIPEILGTDKADVEPDRDAILALTGRSIIRVTADNPPSGFDPVSDAAVPLGIAFHAGLVRAAVLRLFETGKYRDVQIGARPIGEKQVELVITVLPMLRIRRLTISGNNAVKDDEVERAIEYTSGRTIQPDPEVLRMLKQKLLARLAEMGYREAKAELSILTTEEPGGVELVVAVTEGKPDRYTSIEIRGLPEDVPPRIAGISKGIVRNQDKLSKLGQKLLSGLAELGYLDATLAPLEERRIGRYALKLTLTVNPGIRTVLSFKGNEHFLSRDLVELVKKDGPLRTDTESLARKTRFIRSYLLEHGFLFAEVSFARKCIFLDPVLLDRIQDVSEGGSCDASRAYQEIEFRMEEEKAVDVVNVFFDGNTRFTDREMEDELFAFIAEKNKSDELFQPITSDTVNAIGISDKRRFTDAEESDFKAPRFRRQRVYVPEQYADAVNHLASVYQEQGFLSVSISDTCDIDKQHPIQYRHMTFIPIRMSRGKEDEDENAATNQSPCVLVNRDRDQALVLMTVGEGPQTEISEIRFNGNQHLTSLALQQITQVSVNSPYNEYRLREASRKLVEKYKSLGYMFVEVTWEKSFSPDMQRAGVVFTISEGPLTKVGLIRIEGAEDTSLRLIRERLTLQQGDIITPEELEKSQTLLMDLGIFDGATIQMVSPETKAPVKNLKVQVSEAKPQYLELRWGVATVEGVRGSFEYGFNNIGGLALNAALRARANYRLFFFGNPDFEKRYYEMSLIDQLEHHVLVGLSSPHIPRTNGLLGWGIDLIKERINKPGFSASRFTTFLRLDSKIGISAKHPHGLIIGGRFGMEYNLDISPGIQTENPVLQSYLRLPEGKSAFSVIGLSIAVDLRDSPFNPTRGFYFSVEGDWVYSLPFVQDKQDWIEGDPVPIEKKSDLIRTQATLSGYVPLFKTDMVLALSVTVGYIFHLRSDSTTWPDRYFYVGGVDTLRGFPEDSLVPEDIYQRWKSMLKNYGNDIDELLNNRGGEASLITRVELRYPLAKGFFGAGFAEFGNLWRYREGMAPIVFSPSFKIQLRPVAGLGIRYQTPLGPISFDLGVNLDRRPTELPVSWYISIGSAF